MVFFKEIMRSLQEKLAFTNVRNQTECFHGAWGDSENSFDTKTTFGFFPRGLVRPGNLVF